MVISSGFVDNLGETALSSHRVALLNRFFTPTVPTQQEIQENLGVLCIARTAPQKLWVDATVGGGATSSGRIETPSRYRHDRAAYRLCASHQQGHVTVVTHQYVVRSNQSFVRHV